MRKSQGKLKTNITEKNANKSTKYQNFEDPAKVASGRKFLALNANIR